jgi:hypothetical protein
MAAYIVQAVMTFICILYAAISAKKQSSENDADEDSDERRFKNLNLIVDTTAQFSIFISIAALVRKYTGGTFFELAFLQVLVLMQFFSILVVCVTMVELDESYTADDRFDRRFSSTLYFMVGLGLMFANMFEVNTSEAMQSAISQVFSGCPQYTDLEFGYIYINLPHSLKTRLLFYLLGLPGMILFSLWVLVHIITGVHHLGKERWAGVGLALIIYGPLLYFLSCMVGARDIMQKVTGKVFQDNEWGFGQILALLMWAPVFVELIYFCGFIPKRFALLSTRN